MGFSIGRFLGSIAPAVGSIFGPAGTAVGLGVQAGLSRNNGASTAATVGRATQPGPISPAISQPNLRPPVLAPTSIGPTFASLARLPSVIRDIGTGIGLSTLPSILGGGGGNGNQISVILAKARAATGGPVTRNKLIDSAKVCGLEITAQTFGLDVTEVCMVVVKGRTRRRRGVSAADIRRTKRTIGFASKIRKDLKALAR